MPIALSCRCGRSLRLKDELAGKKIRCPECSSILAVPAKKNEADDLVLEVLSAEDDEGAVKRSPRRAAIQAEPPEVRVRSFQPAQLLLAP
jgi:DNA-directed RNA polymerase subunit RPC12/RpoP